MKREDDSKLEEFNICSGGSSAAAQPTNQVGVNYTDRAELEDVKTGGVIELLK